MASISKETRGGTIQWRVFFRNKHGQRQTIRLGRINKRAADSIRVKVESLNVASIAGTDPDETTARWVASIGDDLRQKLINADLLAPEKPPEPQNVPVAALGDFLEQYIAKRNLTKDNTKRNYETTRRQLVDYFGEDRLISDITPGDADEWRQHLLANYSEATVSREVKRARQYFRAAVRKHLIQENPFTDLPSPQQINKSREYFIPQDDTALVIDACPDAQWRLIVALSRYGGLRCPSEHLALELQDIDWERDRMTVRSPKTEHHPDGATRLVPIFPELRPYLSEVWEQAEPGTRYVITRYRQKNANLRTQFERIIKRAGLKTWPKLFHNLRASRETELSEEFPLHVVCAWIGNSPDTARKHYLQVTEDHFRQAAENKGGVLQSQMGATVGDTSGENGCNQWVTPMSANSRHEDKKSRKTQDSEGLRPVLATCGDSWQTESVPPRGVEPLSLD